MKKDLKLNKKLSAIVFDYSIGNYAKEGEQLVDMRYKTRYINKIGKYDLSNLYNSNDNAIDIVEIFDSKK